MKISKDSQVQIDKAITEHYQDGLSQDDLMSVLMSCGVPFSDLTGDYVRLAGLRLGLVLTAEQIVSKVSEGLKGTDKPSHYFDVVDLAKSLVIPQVSFESLVDLVQEHHKTNLKGSSKYLKLVNPRNKSHGAIGQWILENPDFSPSDLINSGIGELEDMQAYYEEFIAYQKFFADLEKQKEGS